MTNDVQDDIKRRTILNSILLSTRKPRPLTQCGVIQKASKLANCYQVGGSLYE